MDKTNQRQDAVNVAVKGELTFEDKVIQKIIGISLDSVPGLLSINGGFFSSITDKLVNTDNVTSGIDVEVGKKQVAVDLDIVAEYGRNIEEIFNSMKEVIVEQVNRMTGLDVIEVNVNVVDVKTRAQHEEDSETVQDKAEDAFESTSEFTSKQAEKANKALKREGNKAKKEMEPRVE